MANFEFFEHTADLGIRFWAGSREELLRSGAEALYAAIGVLQPVGTEHTVSTLNFTATEAATLLRDFLAELLYLVQHEYRIAVEFHLESFTDDFLSLRIELAPLDSIKSTFQREVKAITYHDLKLEQGDQSWTASLIIDI